MHDQRRHRVISGCQASRHVYSVRTGHSSSVSLSFRALTEPVFSFSLGMPARRAVFSGREPPTMSADTILTCRDCGQAFTFTSGEQDFYTGRGFSEPSRCADCRAARKAQREGGGASYTTYAASPSSSYGGGYSSGSERAPREMFSATCSSCGQPAQVPFQPSLDKPVYCSTCFEQRRAGRSAGSYSGSRY
jgi:CxxC-x17-CxxC domain-containing protein